ncbi:lipopolysaccharide biosynthesis protein [Synechococcus sp. MIT S9508]|uniref:lipopolysaccharide biosynthesis protein n=1 Tax=Synechococcus sp. MIT S9508 TaxID=1801629 RepID=UPI0007BC2187|nr:hypothetical protein [Synechococcus sp. MIT S9508]KZR90620.1 Polysaccharide biosynthesis protein [Synechococcus sp. MIT S9508]
MTLGPPPIKKGVLHLFSGALAGRGANFLLNLIISRILGPNGLGLFGLILSSSQAFEIAARGGVDYGLQCKLSEKDNINPESDTKVAIRYVELVTPILLVFLFIWVIPFKGLLPNTLTISRATLTLFLLLICVFESLGGLSWDLFIVHGQTRLVALRQGFFAPLKLLSAAVGAGLYGVSGALIGYGMMSGAQTAWLRNRCRSFWKPELLQKTSWRQMWQLVKSGLPLYGTNALNSLVFLPLLAEVANSAAITDVGYLRIGQLMVQIFNMLPGALAPLLFLKLRYLENDQIRTQNSESPLRLIWSIGLLSLLIYLCVDRRLISLAFGNEFLPSLLPTRLLALAAVLDSVGQMLHTPLLASQRTGIFTFSQNGSSLVAALLGWWLIPQYGLQGYLIAKISYSWLPILIYTIEAWQRYINPKRILILMGASIVITPLCWLNQPSPTIILPMIIIVLGITLRELKQLNMQPEGNP